LGDLHCLQNVVWFGQIWRPWVYFAPALEKNMGKALESLSRAFGD